MESVLRALSASRDRGGAADAPCVRAVETFDGARTLSLEPVRLEECDEQPQSATTAALEGRMRLVDWG
jgi:hypothetical protein